MLDNKRNLCNLCVMNKNHNTAKLRQRSYEAVIELSDLSGVSVAGILDHLVMKEYADVKLGKPPLYPRPTTNEGG